MTYDIISRGYNELYGEEQLKKARVIAKNLKLKKSDVVLDVGCGTGLASSLLKCHRVGIDPSEKLLEKASFPVIRGVAEALPFNDTCFDVVLCVTSIHNFKNVGKALKEMKRVSKGRIVISVLKKSEKFNDINKLINKHFKIIKKIDEEKDLVFFLKKNINTSKGFW